jgi:hypothetical protein
MLIDFDPSVCSNHNKADGFERRLEVSSEGHINMTCVYTLMIISFTLWRTLDMRSIWKGGHDNRPQSLKLSAVVHAATFITLR